MNQPLKIRRALISVSDKAGLIDQDVDEADGRVRPIQLLTAPLQDLRDWADELQAFWQDQLAAFQAHVARRPAPSAPSPAPGPAHVPARRPGARRNRSSAR